MYTMYPEYYLGSYLPPADSYTEFPKLKWAYYGCLCIQDPLCIIENT